MTSNLTKPSTLSLRKWSARKRSGCGTKISKSQLERKYDTKLIQYSEIQVYWCSCYQILSENWMLCWRARDCTRSSGPRQPNQPHPHSPHPLLCCPVFFKEYLNSKFNMNKMIEEHSIKYHPSPSGSTSRINPLIFLQTRVFVDFFTNLYVPKW